MTVHPESDYDPKPRAVASEAHDLEVAGSPRWWESTLTFAGVTGAIGVLFGIVLVVLSLPIRDRLPPMALAGGAVAVAAAVELTAAVAIAVARGLGRSTSASGLAVVCIGAGVHALTGTGVILAIAAGARHDVARALGSPVPLALLGLLLVVLPGVALTLSLRTLQWWRRANAAPALSADEE